MIATSVSQKIAKRGSIMNSKEEREKRIESLLDLLTENLILQGLEEHVPNREDYLGCGVLEQLTHERYLEKMCYRDECHKWGWIYHLIAIIVGSNALSVIALIPITKIISVVVLDAGI